MDIVSYCTLPRSHLHKERSGPTYLVIKLQAPSVKHNEIGWMLRKGQMSARFLGCREEALQLYQTLRCRRVSLNVEEGTATVLECREEGHLLFHTLRCRRGSLEKTCIWKQYSEVDIVSYCTLHRSQLHKERLIPTYLVIKLEGGIIKVFVWN